MLEFYPERVWAEAGRKGRMIMHDLVVNLAKARAEEARMREAAERARHRMMQTTEWEDNEAARIALEEARKKIDVADAALREQAMSRHITGLDLHPAVAIKKFTVVTYDPDKAKEYAINHLPSALKLDKSEFEKVAKVVPLEFVTITKEPRISVASDLSEYLE